MRTTYVNVLGAVMLLGILCSSCQTAPAQMIENEKVAAAQRELKNARMNYLAEWQKFKMETEQEMLLNDKRIDVIKEVMVNNGPLAIKRYRVEMCALQRANRQLAMSLEEYTYDGHAAMKELPLPIVND
jgi:hypothetical protein